MLGLFLMIGRLNSEIIEQKEYVNNSECLHPRILAFSSTSLLSPRSLIVLTFTLIEELIKKRHRP